MGFADFPFQSRHLTLDDHKIHYVDQGDGPVLLFLHGNGGSCYLWRNVIDALQDRYRCIAIDLPGFAGSSSKTPAPLSLAEQCQVIHSVIEQLALERVTLVGHDWGGVMALLLAQQHSERIERLCLMETFPFTFDWHELPLLARPLLFALRRPQLGHFLVVRQSLFTRILLPLAMFRRLPQSVKAAYRLNFRRPGQRRTLLHWINQLPINDQQGETWQQIRQLEDSLSDIKQPILLLQFQPSIFLGPARLRWLRQQLPQLTVKDCGRGLHYVQEDNPIAISVALKEWLPGAMGNSAKAAAVAAQPEPAAAAAPVETTAVASDQAAAIVESDHYKGPLHYSLSNDSELPLLAAWSTQGLVHLSKVSDEQQGLAELRKRFPGSELIADPQRSPPAFNGPSPALHLVGTAFQRHVWRALLAIPEGETRNYGELAAAIGSQPRAVGQAVGRNRIIYFVPCHRVLRADGGLGGFYWGESLKAALLAQEKPA